MLWSQHTEVSGKARKPLDPSPGRCCPTNDHGTDGFEGDEKLLTPQAFLLEKGGLLVILELEHIIADSHVPTEVEQRWLTQGTSL